VQRQRVGLAPNVAADHRHRAEFTHRTGIAENDPVQQAPLDIGKRHPEEGLPTTGPEHDGGLLFLRALLLHQRNQLPGNERSGDECGSEHNTRNGKDDFEVMINQPGPEPPMSPEEQDENHPGDHR
jgi:hypothetical protein